MMQNDVHKMLNDFINYWNESLNGNYHQYEVTQLARNIHNLNYNEQQIQSLQQTERDAYHQAILLYECLEGSRK